MIFTCLSVVAVFVMTPTRAATARARLGSNDGQGEPNRRAEEGLPQV